MKVKLNNVRLAFASIFEATSFGEGDPNFNATLIMEPDSKDSETLQKVIKSVADEKWDDKAAAIIKKLVADDKLAFRKEPYTNKDGDVYDGFDGMHWVRASNKSRPTILDRDKSPLIQSDGKPYSGCYVNAVIDIWAQDNQYGRRINATLMGIQFFKDGDAFGGGGVASDDDFDDFGADEEDDALFG